MNQKIFPSVVCFTIFTIDTLLFIGQPTHVPSSMPIRLRKDAQLEFERWAPLFRAMGLSNNELVSELVLEGIEGLAHRFAKQKGDKLDTLSRTLSHVQNLSNEESSRRNQPRQTAA